MVAECSPMPPVKATASTPPSAAAHLFQQQGGHIAVGDAMESIAAQLQFLADRLRQCVAGGDRREVMVKRGVKNSDGGDVRKQPHPRRDYGQVYGIMQRSQIV